MSAGPPVAAMWTVIKLAEALTEEEAEAWEDPQLQPDVWAAGWAVPTGGRMSVCEVDVSREDMRYVRFRIDLGDAVQPGGDLELPDDFLA